MINKFDELAKGMAQSVSRRQALKKFGVGLAGMTLGCFGLANVAEAAKGGKGCLSTGEHCDPTGKNNHCCSGRCICGNINGGCYGNYGFYVCA